jgi:hypothetical protein
MLPPKTLRERETELRALLATTDGQQAVEALATRYAREGDKMRPARTSAITYILVHERAKGLIAG